ncbi:unnamed protein product [Arctogadus glacialis]
MLLIFIYYYYCYYYDDYFKTIILFCVCLKRFSASIWSFFFSWSGRITLRSHSVGNCVYINGILTDCVRKTYKSWCCPRHTVADLKLGFLESVLLDEWYAGSYPAQIRIREKMFLNCSMLFVFVFFKD